MMAGTGADRLAALAGGAPQRSANVRSLARFAANSTCNLATLGFATRVDFDRLLVGTKYEVPYGQSPFAFIRGDQFENRLRADGHKPLLTLLGQRPGFDVSSARVANLKKGFQPNRQGMIDRAKKTSELLGEIIRGTAAAPNLIDGAVLERAIGGVTAHFEADAVAAQFGSPILAGEVKSFPTVDGQADPDKVGAAMAQVAIYIVLLREEVGRLGGDPALVSEEALLITPLNTGLQPTMTSKVLRREIDRAERILRSVPSAIELAREVPDSVPGFDAVFKGDVSARTEAAHQLAEHVGTHYAPACLSACGLSRLCRERAHTSGDPALLGQQMVRLLPNVESLDRAHELAHGKAPQGAEQPVAEQLARCNRLVEDLVPASRLGRAGRGPGRKGRAS